MTRTFRMKSMAAAFVPALFLAASATYAAGDYKSPSANVTGTTATAPAGTSSMKSGTTVSADATFDRLDVNHDGKLSASEAAAIFFASSRVRVIRVFMMNVSAFVIKKPASTRKRRVGLLLMIVWIIQVENIED